MNYFYKTDNSILSKPRFYRPYWMTFLSLFFIVMIVPTIIVNSAGNTGHFQETMNITNQAQSPNRLPNGQEPFLKSTLTLGWVSGSEQGLQNLVDYKNLNVVSPVLSTIDNQFNLQVITDPAITNTIQAQGKMIWSRIIINSDTESNVHAFLTNHDKMQELIRQIHQSAVKYKWNGVNLDIENVSSGDRDAFSQFIKNLAKELTNTSIMLSIDLPPDPGETNNEQSPFDHKVIGEYCNYVVFMGYDQHWSTDPVPGPITSLSWLKQNLQEFIRTGISSDKIIMGLPAYTRIWEQNTQGYIVNDPAEPIQYVESLVKQNHRNLSWDSALGEYFTSYTVNNVQYKIWLPTVKSLTIYRQLIPQLHLAGTAVWNLNLMNSDYWNQIFPD